MNRYRLIYILALTVLLAVNEVKAQDPEPATTSGLRVHGSVYGGGNLADVKTNTEVNICASYNATSEKWESVSVGEGVTIEGSVFGGGKGTGENSFKCDKAMVGVDGEGLTDNNGGTTVRIGNGTVNHNVYGGGEVGRVEKNTVVAVGIEGDDNSKPLIKGNVFGAGEGLVTHGYSALVRGNSSVTVQGAAEVQRSVYGGGQIATVGRYIVVDGYPTEPNGGGICTVNIKDKAKVSGNVVGAGQGVTPEFDAAGSKHMIPSGSLVTFADEPAYLTFLETLALVSETAVTIGGNVANKKAVVLGNVYGGSESGFLQRHTQVTISDNCEIGTTSAGGNIYGGGKGLPAFAEAGRVSGYTSVTVNGGTTNGSVFGGGELGYVKGGVKVALTGSTATVEGDVYGGGALADTNIGNGNEYIAVPGLTTGASVAGLGLYEKKYKTTADQGAIDGKTYYEVVNGVYVVKNGLTTGASVTGLSEIEFKATTDEKAALGKTYYEYKADPGIYVVKNGLTAGSSSVSGLFEITYNETGDGTVTAGKTYYTITHPTAVDLTGGLVKGDAYGGGLGQKDGFNSATSDIAATVYGDIAVTLDGTKFDINYYSDQGFTDVVKSGRVFGCNNLLGSPQGNVTVTVNKTVKGNTGRTVNDEHGDLRKSEDPDDHSYELAAVYGGGNLAPFTASGKKTHVIIRGCNDTSILTVYGGGNAAAVNESSVDVYSAYEIGSLFGGGNGKDKYKNDAGWQTNPGANVNGDATTWIYGGTVHEAYGGSNEKGTVSGTVTIDIASTNPDGCPLDVAKIVGAGKNADIDGNLILVMGCKPGEKIPVVYGGADNANVNGNVELTITSGNFGKVFGGNNDGGVIMGHIKLNIEETGDCQTPITIDELYLGGNQAAYSVYGYYKDGNGKWRPRTSADDTHTPQPFHEEDPAYNNTDNTFEEYGNPELNVIACTRIGRVYGGGFGSGATLYGDPIVNINMIPGSKANLIDRDGNGSADGDANLLGAIGGSYTNADGDEVDGGVFGGGDGAEVRGNTTVNIGTATTVEMNTEPIHLGAEGTAYIEVTKPGGKKVYEVPVKGAYIVGDVFGGGNLADVTGNTFVNICAKYNEGTTKYEAVAEGASGVIIGGTVYGGGKGLEDTFTCEKAMIGEDGLGANNPTYPNGNTSVRIGHGTVNGSVYGGGKVGRVEMNTDVEIGFGEGDSGTHTPVIEGNVFGAGAGVKTHGYSALVRGNTHVTIQGDAWVKKSVYGGGEIASVARYNVAQDDEEGAPYGVGAGEPYLLANNNSGYCYVTVQGHAEIGTDGMQMYHEVNGSIPDDDKPDDWGHVFAAGKGVLPETYDFEHFSAATRKSYPKRMARYNAKDYKEADKGTTWEYVDPDHSDTNLNIWEYFNTEAKYFTFIQTLGLATQTNVTVDGTAFVKGSVYGGSENGLVQFNTYVTIDGDCQIGQGEGVYRRYTTAEWAYDGSEDSKSLAECAHWEFKEPYAPYDPYAKYRKAADGNYYYDTSFTKSAEGGAKIATDGHSYYGNVFGGGSGSIPYFNSLEGVSEYISTAGMVKGNTYVTISGGHILTSVYGGCEATNVLGDANVTMTDGTIGVPRTLDQIMAHPVTCFLFGAGKGDQRIFFNKETNVRDAIVTIKGGKIYGTAFGGGEDGHVLRHVTMTIGEEGKTTGPTIGTLGTSYFDGNVFGGGRGFGGDALTAGNVGGSVDLKIHGGNILGSVYGGGRLASVGYGLYLTTETGYGVLRADNEYDNPANPPSTVTAAEYFGSKGRGHINITINGGTIGNDAEYVYNPAAAVIGATGSLRNTEFEDYKINETTTIKRLKHTKGGNVFAGSMGRLYKMDGTTPNIIWQENANPDILWERLAHAKQTTLTITGGTIKSCVYGGGEMGMVDGRSMVDDQYSTTIADNKYATTVNITGGTIGTEIKDNNVTQYTFGSVFGGGYGSTVEAFKDTDENEVSNPKLSAGLIYGSAHVTMSGGTVLASVYGGGETASVDGSTNVAVSGGTIGKNKDTDNDISFGGATMGNVYGGGSGNRDIVRAGRIFGNTNVTISQADASKPTRIYHNIYGGGAYGTVGDFEYHYSTPITGPYAGISKVDGVTGLKEGTSGGKATITITGGTIGVDGKENGMIFGSSRGDVDAPGQRDDFVAWVYDTEVTIGSSTDGSNYVTPWIKGSVYGSGENGHTWNDTEVKIHSGLIGVKESDALGGADYAYRGNVYGGGCGTDTYTYIENEGTENEKSYQRYNHSAGIVRGQTTVTIDGGQVVHNVYGGGAMGSVGKIANYDDLDDPTKDYKHAASTSDGKTFYDFGLSWPYEFTYGNENANVGKTSVTITGSAVIGVSGSKGGHVFGAARGAVDVGEDDITKQRYEEAKLANVRSTQVTIGTQNGTATTPTIYGSVYGGGEDGHVYDNATVTIHHGAIAHSVFGGGKGEGTFETTLWNPQSEGNPKDSPENVHSWIAGKVYGNTFVTMNGGSVGYSIYGGGNLASVGKGNYAGGSDDYSTAGYGEWGTKNNDGTGGPLWTANPTAGTYPYYFANSGKATVTINGGTLGTPGVLYDDLPTGNVFGSSRGMAAASVQLSPRYRYVPDFFLGYTNETEVTIGGTSGDGPTVYGSVYGGGQDGHVRRGTNVIINRGTIGDADQARGGNIFGSGSGIGTYKDGTTDKCNNSSGSVTCTTTITVNDGHIVGSVYGGGSLASVGPPHTGQGFDEYMTTDNYSTGNRAHGSLSYTQVNIKGGTIGGSVYGASRGPHDNMSSDVLAFINSTDYDATKFANVLWSNVNITGSANITGSVYGGGQKGLVKHATVVNIGTTGTGGAAFTGTISQDVFGGGKEAVVGGNVTVNMNSGTVSQSVYGGGALAHTNVNKTAETLTLTGAKATTDEANATTTVNLKGGQINGNAFGGGLGRQEVKTDNVITTPGIAALVYGDVLVELNRDVADDEKGCIVDKIFGCNNLNGTPKGHAKVHVHATQNKDNDKPTILDKYDTYTLESQYDVSAVYGGGRQADYDPEDELLSTEVIIEGCNLTSIYEVYGGGYGAATPGTNVLIKGTKIINEVFGGGYGKSTTDFPDNPGANVGYRTDGEVYGKDVNGETKVAIVQLMAGKVNSVYGGSNSKGDIRNGASMTTVDTEWQQGDGSTAPCCDKLEVGDIYGGGKEAEMQGGAEIVLSCMPNDWIGEIYAGAREADVGSDVSLTLTSGKFGRVFGGNRKSGKIDGSITVNIEENPECDTPIIIGELYGGGDEAPYSVYGYKEENGTLTVLKAGDTGANDTPFGGPYLNVKAFTSIGNIYGGGYGSMATLVGNPTVNINEVLIDVTGLSATGETLRNYEGEEKTLPQGTGTVEVRLYPHEVGKMGVIGNVFGGGNAAQVIGNTNVNIGTAEEVPFASLPLVPVLDGQGNPIYETDQNGDKIQEVNANGQLVYESDGTTPVYVKKKQAQVKTVVGADIRGNVYGGGNKADVTGDTNVNIGKKNQSE